MMLRRGDCVRHAGCVGDGKRGIGEDLGRNNHGQQREKEIKEKVMHRQVAQDSRRDLLHPQIHQSL